jgi:hypothetical protein
LSSEKAQDLAYIYWIRYAASLRTSASAAASQQELDRLFRYCQEFDITLGPETQAALVEYYGDTAGPLAEQQEGYQAELGR